LKRAETGYPADVTDPQADAEAVDAQPVDPPRVGDSRADNRAPTGGPPVRRVAGGPPVRRVAAPTPGSGRRLVIFAIVGVVLALAAGGFYIYRVATAPERATPETVVEQFLDAVFVQNNADQLAPLLCSTWQPQRAMTWVTSQVDPRARMSWDEIVVVQADRERANVLVELGYQFPGDAQPSAHRQWRFRLFDENGWRVCDARPFTG
jgi:hypothetical protein